MKWPGAGKPEADALVMKHVLQVESLNGMLAAGAMPGNRSLVPPVTTFLPSCVSHILTEMEDEGWLFMLTNISGRYEAVFKLGSRRGEGSSRRWAAEAVCLAAMRAKGIEVES